MESTEDRNKKTRFRVPTTCTLCRRRKIKCDRQKPHCVSCIKSRSTHLCHYEEQPWAADNEVQKLKEQVFQLQQQNNELKSLLNRRGNKGPEDNIILPDETHDDAILELADKFNVLMLKENKMSHYGSSSYMALVSQDPVLRNIFKKFLNTQSWGINLEKYFLYDQGIMPLNDNPCSSLAPMTQSSVFESDLNKNHQVLVEQINEALPDKTVLFALVDHFFSEAYAFVPYVDEDSFRKNMESLVSSSPSGKACLVVTSVTQMVTVATMLTVLRFSFLTLPMSNTRQLKNRVVETILESNVQIPPYYVELAKACISNASALRKPTLKHIQSLLLLRLYRFYAPEDGDEGSDSTIFLSLIVQMAKMHGMHRDPSRFPAVQDHATANIWRKIWTQLMYLDAMQAFTFGCPLLIDDEYDTELPIRSSSDSPMEKTAIDYLIKMNEVTQLLKSLVRTTSTVNTDPKRSDIEKSLKEVEYVLMKYRSIEELSSMYKPSETFLSRITRVTDLSLKIVMYNFQSVFYYILMLTCETDELYLQRKYTIKAAECSFIVFKTCHDYSMGPHRYMKGLNSEIFLSAPIFEASKRCFQQVISFCFRDMSGMFNLPKIVDGFSLTDSQGIADWLVPFHSSLTMGDQGVVRLEEFIQYCSRMSNRYFICWRLVFINKMIEDYIDSQFPGKFDEIHEKIQQYNSANQESQIGLDIKGVQAEVDDATTMNSAAQEVFQQFVDADNQSKFDYLIPNLTSQNGDPFYDNGTPLTGTFEDFNSILDYGATGSFSFGSISGSTDHGSSTNEDVSPKTDSSDGQSVKHPQESPVDFKSIPQNGLLPDLMIKGGLTEQEVAMQVAHSMFGGSTDLFGSSSMGL